MDARTMESIVRELEDARAERAHARPADVRATALATAVYDALAGFGPDPSPAQLAATVGWSDAAFAAAVRRVVAAARAELRREQQQTMFEEAA